MVVDVSGTVANIERAWPATYGVQPLFKQRYRADSDRDLYG